MMTCVFVQHRRIYSILTKFFVENLDKSEQIGYTNSGVDVWHSDVGRNNARVTAGRLYFYFFRLLPVKLLAELSCVGCGVLCGDFDAVNTCRPPARLGIDLRRILFFVFSCQGDFTWLSISPNSISAAEFVRKCFVKALVDFRRNVW